MTLAQLPFPKGNSNKEQMLAMSTWAPIMRYESFQVHVTQVFFRNRQKKWKSELNKRHQHSHRSLKNIATHDKCQKSQHEPQSWDMRILRCREVRFFRKETQKIWSWIKHATPPQLPFPKKHSNSQQMLVTSNKKMIEFYIAFYHPNSNGVCKIEF